jgi:hypothetical protein
MMLSKGHSCFPAAVQHLPGQSGSTAGSSASWELGRSGRLARAWVWRQPQALAQGGEAGMCQSRTACTGMARRHHRRVWEAVLLQGFDFAVRV